MKSVGDRRPRPTADHTAQPRLRHYLAQQQQQQQLYLPLRLLFNDCQSCEIVSAVGRNSNVRAHSAVVVVVVVFPVSSVTQCQCQCLTLPTVSIPVGGILRKQMGHLGCCSSTQRRERKGIISVPKQGNKARQVVGQFTARLRA